MNPMYFIVHGNCATHLKIKGNLKKVYEFTNKQYTLKTIMFENIKELIIYVSRKVEELEFEIPYIEISSNDAINVQNRIMSIDPEKRKALKINKSTLWYQQKKIKVYSKTKVRIE